MNRGVLNLFANCSAFLKLFSLMFSTRMAGLVVERDRCSRDTFHICAQVELGVIYLALELHDICLENRGRE